MRQHTHSAIRNEPHSHHSFPNHHSCIQEIVSILKSSYFDSEQNVVAQLPEDVLSAASHPLRTAG
ncbi:MAG: hypothetical protein VB853_06430, partial [Pirellulales bacterium]